MIQHPGTNKYETSAQQNRHHGNPAIKRQITLGTLPAPHTLIGNKWFRSRAGYFFPDPFRFQMFHFLAGQAQHLNVIGIMAITIIDNSGTHDGTSLQKGRDRSIALLFANGRTKYLRA
jgi:hypothetical protein